MSLHMKPQPAARGQQVKKTSLVLYKEILFPKACQSLAKREKPQPLTPQISASLQELCLVMIAAACHLLTASPLTSELAISERGNKLLDASWAASKE